MKKLLYTIASLAALTAIACTKEQGTPEVRPEIPDTPEEVIEVPATLSGSMGDPTTKVSNDNNGAYKWQASDHVTILTNNGANREFSADEAGLTTEFSGHIPNTDALVGGFALYPASSNLEADHHSISGKTITFNIPTTLTWGADASYMPMYAPIGVDPEDVQKVKASFKAVGGAMKLICYNIPEDATTLAFTANVNITGNFTVDRTTDPDNPTLIGAGSGKEIDIDFTGNYSDNKVFYIPLPPVTLTGGFTISFKNGNTVLFSQTAAAAPTIQRNHLLIAPALNCAAVLWSEDFQQYSKDDVPGKKSGENYHGATGYTCINGNSDTKIYNEMLAGGNSPELLINKTGGSFKASGIRTNNAASLTLTFKVNNTITVTATSGITVGSFDTGAGTKSVTLTNTGNVASFDLTFSNSSSSNARIDDIKVINPSSTVTAPSLTSTDDALTIGVGESSASTTVTLTNAVDGLGISALMSGANADKFTAAISGTTLTVTAKETNSSAADYTATVTLKASGATAKAIAVTQTTNLVPNPTDLNAESGSASVDISWTPNAKATGYVAYIRKTADGDIVDGEGNLKEDDKTITVTGFTLVEGKYTKTVDELSNGNEYTLYVKVSTVSDGGWVAPSDYATTTFTPVAAKELVSIALTTNPTQTTYNIGDTFSLTGAVVTATYNDSTTADVTSSCTATYDFSTMGAKTVTISYTEGVITRTCDCNVTVAAVDVLTFSDLSAGMSGNNEYKAFSGIAGSASAAIYSGQIYYTSTLSYIQIRNQSPSGIVTTTSGGLVKKVSVTYGGNNTTGKILTIYGKNSAYSGPADLYDDNKGTPIGTITFSQNDTSGYVDISGDYEYVGLRPNGAMYFGKIDIQWEPGTPTIAMAKTSISGVAAAGVNNASESAVYTFKNGATDADVTVTCDGSIVTSASKNSGAITYTVAANTGAAREGWINVKYGSEDPHTVTVSQNAATYTLTLNSGGNGTVAATVDAAAVASGSAVAVGKTVSITTTPSSGYQLSALSYNDGSAHDIISTKSFTMPSAAVTVSATFSAVPTITMDKTSITDVAAAGVTNASESGVYSFHNGATDADVTVTCDGDVVTSASKNNGAITYTVTANTGAARDGWIDVKYGNESAHRVTVSQNAATYTLTLSSGGNGTVTATVDEVAVSSGSPVAVGKTVSITTTPSSGYQLSALSYNDGSAHDIISTKSFTMPSVAVTVSATFAAAANEYTYTFTSKSWAATRGGNQENWVSGKDGGQLTSDRGIQVTEAATGANGTSPNSFTDVEEVIVTYSTNANSGAGSILVKVGNGTAKSSSVTKTGGTTDRELTFSYTTKESGKVNVTVNCTTNSIYIKSVTIKAANMVIPVAHSITCASVTNGSISSNKATAYADETVTLTATPTSGYKLGAWSVYKTGDPGTIITVTNNAFTMPDYAVTVSASFVEDQGGETVVTFDAGTDTSSDTTLSKNGVTITTTSGTFSRTDNYRVYANNSMTITAPTGKVLKRIVFTVTQNTFTAPAAGSWDDDSKTWTKGTDSPNSVTLSASGGQVRITKIVVTYE